MLQQPPIDTFGPSKVWLSLLALAALLIASMSFYSPFAENDLDFIWPGRLLALLFALWFVWVLSVKVSFHPNGIAYRSLFGARDMLWDEVDRFYYEARKMSVYFIPIGTIFSFKLVSAKRERISFGKGLERGAEIGNKLEQATYPSLFRRATDLFDNGVEVDFGPVRLSRSTGIHIKKLFRAVNIPLDSVADYRIEGGKLYVWRIGQKRTKTRPEDPFDWGVAIRRIPNVFVLLGILDAFYEQRGRSSSI